MFAQVAGDAVAVGCHAFVALVPASGANLAMLFMELQGINHPQGFINIAAKRQIIDDLMANHTGLIDQEGATQGNTGIGKDAIIAGNILGQISHQGEANFTQTTVIYRCTAPCGMGMNAVHRNTDQLGTDFGETADPVIVGENFRRTYKCKIQRIEEQETIAAIKPAGQVESFVNLAICQHGSGSEIRRFRADKGGRWMGSS